MTEPSELLRCERGAPIARERPNPVVLEPLMIVCLVSSELELSHPSRPFQLTFQPVTEGYAICVQHTLGGTLPPPSNPLRLGRVGVDGLVVSRDETTIDDPVKTAPDGSNHQSGNDAVWYSSMNVLMVDSFEARTVYWCRDRASFDDLHRQLRAAPHAKPVGVTGFEIGHTDREHASAPIADLELLEKTARDSFIDHNLFRSAGIAHRGSWDSWEHAMVDVTPPCIRALYTAELMQWYTLVAQRASARHLATLEHAAAMVDAAERGAKDLCLEERANQLFRAPGERHVFDYFRDYVWRCAATAMSTKVVQLSLAMDVEDWPGGVREAQPDDLDAGVKPVPEARWLRAAIEIRDASTGEKNGPAVHPYLQGVAEPLRHDREWPTLDDDQQTLLVDYYESYLFGAHLRGQTPDGVDGFVQSTDFRERVAVRFQDFESTRESVAVRMRALMKQHLDSVSLLSSLARCYPNDHHLWPRYLDVAGFCGFRWWEPLCVSERADPPSLNTSGEYDEEPWPFWKTFKTRLKPIAEGGKSAGKASKILRDWLSNYDLSETQLLEVLDTVGRLEVTLAGGTVSGRSHTLIAPANGGAPGAQPRRIRASTLQADLEISPGSGEAHVSLHGVRTPGASSSFTFRFMRELSTPALTGTGAIAPLSPTSSVPQRRYGPAGAASAQYAVLVPAGDAYLREMSRYSEAFAMLADSVNVAIAFTTIVDQHGAKQDKLIACFDLTKGVVGVLNGLRSTLSFAAPKLDAPKLVAGLKSGESMLKPLAALLTKIDHATKIYKGLTILFGDDANVHREQRYGQSYRAELQRLSDRATVVVAGASAVELAGGVAAATGAGEILGVSATTLGAFSTTPWGLLIVGGGTLVIAASALLLDLSEPWSKRLMQLEDALEHARKEVIRGRRLLVTTRLDTLLRVVDNGWSMPPRGT